jgi:PRTRC genetic system protein B
MQLTTQLATTQCSLKAAMLIYQRTGNDGSEGGIATVHHVLNVQGKPVLAPGRHMTVDDYENLVLVLNPAADRYKWRDDDVLFESPKCTIWWTAPKAQGVFFKVPGTVLENAKGAAPMPGLIWVMTGGSNLDVYAYKGGTRPTKKTQLYQAPFFNVNESGDVCLGNASLPNRRASNYLQRVEASFFASYFTHPSVAEGRLIEGHEPHQFWREMLDGKYKTFPEDVLVKLDSVAGDLMPDGE